MVHMNMVAFCYIAGNTKTVENVPSARKSYGVLPAIRWAAGPE